MTRPIGIMMAVTLLVACSGKTDRQKSPPASAAREPVSANDPAPATAGPGQATAADRPSEPEQPSTATSDDVAPAQPTAATAPEATPVQPGETDESSENTQPSAPAQPNATTAEGDMLARATKHADELCACADEPCVRAAEKKWIAVTEKAFAAKLPADATDDERIQRDRLTKAVLQQASSMAACKKRLGIAKPIPSIAPTHGTETSAAPAAAPIEKLSAKQVTKRVKKLADEMCACKSVKCGEKVQRKLAEVAVAAGEMTAKQQATNVQFIDGLDLCWNALQAHDKAGAGGH